MELRGKKLRDAEKNYIMQNLEIAPIRHCYEKRIKKVARIA